MTGPDYAALDTALRSLSGLQVAPIAITFSDQAPPNIVPYDSPMSSPTPDGRTGITMEIMPTVPVVQDRPNFIIYGPLQETPAALDVVLLRLNARQAMVLSDALPELRFEGKPQCHSVPMAKEGQDVAVSVGYLLSRVRTGMSNHEMTGAISGPRLAEVAEKLQATCVADTTVAVYASEDKRRFDV